MTHYCTRFLVGNYEAPPLKKWVHLRPTCVSKWLFPKLTAAAYNLTITSEMVRLTALRGKGIDHSCGPWLKNSVALVVVGKYLENTWTQHSLL